MGFLRNLTDANVDNAPQAYRAKVEIRRRVLEAVGAKVVVFDGFAGAGHMWREVWHEAGGYVGCDREWHPESPHVAFVADNRRVLRCVDLQPFTVFDFDAYGSPWEQVYILTARRPVGKGERVGLVLTEGSGLKLRGGDLPYALSLFAGLHGRVAGPARLQDEILDRAIAGLALRWRCRLLRRWQASGVTGACMRYVGLVLAGLGGE